MKYAFVVASKDSKVSLTISGRAVKFKVVTTLRLNSCEYDVHVELEYNIKEDKGMITVLIPHVSYFMSEIHEDELNEFLNRLIELVDEFFKDFVEAKVEVEGQ